jgi:hypothetical protein
MILPEAAGSQVKYRAGTQVTKMSAGPYFSGQLGLGSAVTRCINKIHEDCFFWTPAGCDGVSANPVFSLTSVNSYPFCADLFSCGFNTYCSGTCTAQCELIGPEPPPRDNCPIVIAMDQKVHLTDLARGVHFDIDADGVQDRIAWTDPRWNTAFLVLDRNDDGVINDGTELFGSHTDQPTSAEPNGFIALAVFDRTPLGGNGDGVISEGDSVFAALRLWADTNHDGQSQHEELRSLVQGGIIAIDLRYHETGRHDRFGNYLRYHAKVLLAAGEARAIDVFFLGE